MTLAAPYPVELLRVAKKLGWYDNPEETLADLPAFLAQVMIYGSAADLQTVERFVPPIFRSLAGEMETISRQAYGFRNFENYRQRVQVLCA